MALSDNAWYINFGDGSTTGYYAVTAWAALTTYDCGTLRRQLAAPAVGSERVFVVIVGHVASGAAEPTWVITRGGKTTDATITWQEATGIAALNGDKTNTPLWSNASIKNSAITLGQVIQSVNGNFILICTTAGTAGNGAEPTWAAYTTAGATTADNTVTWTTLKDSGNNFGNWAAPHARLANSYASTWGAGGTNATPNFFLASISAETQAGAITLTIPQSTSELGSNTYCVSTAAVPPTAATTGATVTSSGGAITFQNTGTFNGIAFVAAGSISLANNSGDFNEIFLNCGFSLTASFALLAIGRNANVANRQTTVLNNTPVTFNNVNQTISVSSTANAKILNTPSFIVGSVPTTLFSPTGCGTLDISAVDLSAAGAGKTLIGAGAFQGRMTLSYCKLGASVTVAGTPTVSAGYVDLISCDSGATNYRDERYRYAGTQTVETTIIRTGGATDGTTPISWKIASTANSKWLFPFEAQPITIWNDSTVAISTLTFYGTTTGGGVPNNDDIWVEVEYLGSGSTPQGSFITSTKTDNLAASTTTNNSSDSSTWGGAGAGNGFKIVVPSFTPGMKGPLNIVIKVGKASATYYVDPRPSISGVIVSKSEILAPGVYVNELSTAGMLEYSGMVGGMNG